MNIQVKANTGSFLQKRNLKKQGAVAILAS